MGIPSFYRHLVKTHPSLIKKVSERKAAVLALDLNCSIYHCLSKLNKKIKYEIKNRISFEDELIRQVILYIQKLRDHVQPTDLLYVAVDGVVPMAKIRQQRMRRFKSVWQTAEETRIKTECGNAAAGAESWDRNSITPGTEFMDRLTERLHTWQKGQLSSAKIVISGVDESGEGEQKIMAYLRAHNPSGEVIVYGLDADLIVLCLWHHGEYGWNFKLLREEVEMRGGVKVNAFGEENLLYFDIDTLAEVITDTWKISLRDYVGAMSFLGNDFVPHGLTLCIREEGVERIMEICETVGGGLVVKDGNGRWIYDITVLGRIIASVAEQEETWVLKSLKNKLKMSAHGGPARRGEGEISDEEKALNSLNMLPITWKVEKAITERTEDGWIFRADWTKNYYNDFLWGASSAKVSAEWLKGIRWVLDYYTGSRDVDTLWYYPWYLPPLFKDIVVKPEVDGDSVKNAVNPIKPLAQLLMVLPEESYSLLPANKRNLPNMRPEYFPKVWTFFSAGRRMLWECEPLIPMMPYNVVRRIL